MPLVHLVIGLALVVIFSKLFALPPGAAGGILAGSQTMKDRIIENTHLAFSVLR